MLHRKYHCSKLRAEYAVPSVNIMFFNYKRTTILTIQTTRDLKKGFDSSRNDKIIFKMSFIFSVLYWYCLEMRAHQKDSQSNITHLAISKRQFTQKYHFCYFHVAPNPLRHFWIKSKQICAKNNQQAIAVISQSKLTIDPICDPGPQNQS